MNTALRRPLALVVALSVLGALFASIAAAPSANAQSQNAPNASSWPANYDWKLRPLMFQDGKAPIGPGFGESFVADPMQPGTQCNPHQRPYMCFAVTPDGKRISRPGIGTQFDFTRNNNGRMNGHKIPVPGWATGGLDAFVEYADQVSPVNFGQAEGISMGPAKGWAGVGATPASKKAICAGFLGIPGHPAEGDCIKNGVIKANTAPGGMAWSAWLKTVHDNYADEHTWRWKATGGPYGEWYSDTRQFVTFVWVAFPKTTTTTACTTPPCTTTTVPGGGGGVTTTTLPPGTRVPGDLDVEVNVPEAGQVGGALAPVQRISTRLGTLMCNGQVAPCGAPVAGQTMGPYLTSVNSSPGIQLTPPAGYSAGRGPNDAYRITRTFTASNGTGDMELEFYKPTPATQQYHVAANGWTAQVRYDTYGLVCVAGFTTPVVVDRRGRYVSGGDFICTRQETQVVSSRTQTIPITPQYDPYQQFHVVSAQMN